MGEQIIAINGQDTLKMTHKEAVALLKQAQGSVEIEVAPAADDSESAGENSSDEDSMHG